MQLNSESSYKTLEFAINRALSISPATHGVWTKVEGHRVWRVHLITPGAFSVGLIFDDYHLGEGIKLMIYDPQKKHVKGAFTSLNNKPSGIFAVGHIPGEEVIIELQVPAHLADFGELSLGSLSHAFLPSAIKGTLDNRYGRSMPCEIDINCEEGTEWQLEKRAVVRINNLYNDLYCTGVLLNNTSYNGDPLLITAKHCIESEEGAEQSIFHFNYESPSCYGGDGSNDLSLSGAELISVGDSIDFTMVRLSLPPPDSFDVYYAGWDLTKTPTAPSTTIHHPEGDVKKISFDFEAPDSTSMLSQIPSNFWNFLSHSFWWIKQWDIGSTEPGSSGSPLFSPKSKVIGILSFGSAKCGDSIDYDAETDRVIYDKEVNVDDYYTRLGVAWDYNSEPERSLKSWLDPAGTGKTSLQGLQPGGFPEERIVMGSVFTLWPNPAGNKIWFSAHTEQEGSATFKIFDLRGSLLHRGEVSLPGPVQVNVDELQSGLYFLFIEYGARHELLKFVKSQ